MRHLFPVFCCLKETAGSSSSAHIVRCHSPKTPDLRQSGARHSSRAASALILGLGFNIENIQNKVRAVAAKSTCPEKRAEASVHVRGAESIWQAIAGLATVMVRLRRCAKPLMALTPASRQKAAPGKPAIPCVRFGKLVPDWRHPESRAAILVLNIWKKPVARLCLLGQQLGHSWSHFK
jgi:hypothetical protein